MLALTLFLSALSSSALAKAKAPAACTVKYASLYRQTRRSFLTPDDLRTLNVLRNDLRVSPEARAKKIFRLVLEARLRQADPAVAREVRQVYRDFEVSYADAIHGLHQDVKGTLPDGSHFRATSYEVTVPEELADSAVEQFIKLHETEHAVQAKSLERAGLDRGKSIADEILREKASIAMEWQALRQIAPEDLAELARRVARLTRISPEEKEYVLSALRDAHLPQKAYIERQLVARGYDKASLVSEQRRMVAKVAGGSILFLAAGVGAMEYALATPR